MNELTWHQLPIDAGQIVDVTYACDWDAMRLYRRSHDRSDGTVTTTYYMIDETSDAPFEPQNGLLPDTIGDAIPVR